MISNKEYAVLTPPALQILNRLKNQPGGYIPYAEWESADGLYVTELKRFGYIVEEERELGLRLTGLPDILYAWELTEGLDTGFVGCEARSFPVLGSTNQYAYEWAMQGAPHGAVVIADHQSQGRGRFDRPWASPEQKGVYFTLILRPDLPMSQMPLFTLLSAIVVTEAANEYTGVQAVIKWPNDVLCAGAKLCGILAEVRAGRQGKPDFAVIGIGINVNLDPEDFPSGAQGTSLKMLHGGPVSRVDFLRRLLQLMELHYLGFIHKGFDYLKDLWMRYNCTLDRDISINTNDGNVLAGYSLGLSDRGGLLVRLEDGLCQEFLAGDVSIGSQDFQLRK